MYILIINKRVTSIFPSCPDSPSQAQLGGLGAVVSPPCPALSSPKALAGTAANAGFLIKTNKPCPAPPGGTQGKNPRKRNLFLKLRNPHSPCTAGQGQKWR